ncbi:MAG: hypothetical protein AMXMBFR83_23080 [Phycisphaerae bacterium]
MIAAGVLFLIWSAAAWAQAGAHLDAASVQRRFAEAQADFEAARAKGSEAGLDSLEARRLFRASAEQFAALAREGVTAANLYVNAGNAFHFAGDEPRALLWYLRAERVSRTPEVRSGLATLRRLCRAEPWPPPRESIGRVLMFWHYDLDRRVKQALLLAFYPPGCVLAGVGLFVRRPRRWFRAGAALMVIGGLLGVSDAVAATTGGPRWAVVLNTTPGYAGDGRMYSIVVDSLPPGQEVKLVERRPEWARVELPSGTRAWLPAEAVEAVSLLEASTR